MRIGPRTALGLGVLLLAPVVVLGQTGITGSVRPVKIPTHKHRDLSDGSKIPLRSIEGITSSGTAGSIAYLDVAQSWTAAQTFSFEATLGDGVEDPSLLFQGSGGAIAVRMESPSGGDSYIAELPNLGSVVAQRFVFVGATQTLTNKTLTTPTIASFTNATHTHGDAAGGGTLNASAIAAGTLPVARGGTGVTSSTGSTNLVLSDSPTLATPTLTTPTLADFTNAGHDHLDADDGGTLSASAIASGTLAAARVYADVDRLSGDATSTSSVLADISGLELDVAANTTYQYKFVLFWSSSNTTNGVTFALNAPASSTLYGRWDIGNRTGGAANASGVFSLDFDASATTANVTSVVTANRVNMATVEGYLSTAGTAGTLQIQFADEDDISTTTVYAGSHGFLTALP